MSGEVVITVIESCGFIPMVGTKQESIEESGRDCWLAETKKLELRVKYTKGLHRDSQD